MKPIFEYQDIVLQTLKDQAAPFYLAGGTALAKFYFQHRDSYDLDFFSQNYSRVKIRELVHLIEKTTEKKMKLIQESHRAGLAKISIYDLILGKGGSLKIDFVEDVLPLLSPLKRVDGVDILSLDDIYLRKIHAISGTLPEMDIVGQKRFLGGRAEAKDFYDVYQLSSTYKRLSRFALEHCDDLQKEALVRWFHTYSRSEMKIGLMELKTRNPVEFVILERHFKKEIDELIKGILP
jgi:predicted nucleotidyltransferase component of viral defense system